MFEESRENTGGVIAGMLRSLEDGHLDIVPSAELKKAELAASPANSSSDEVLEMAGDFNYDGYQVVRREFFAHINEPSVTFNNYKFYVNTACLNRFPQVDYVQVLVNQESRILAIRPCRAEDRDACAWCTNGSGRRKPKQITCKIFFAKGYHDVFVRACLSIAFATLAFATSVANFVTRDAAPPTPSITPMRMTSSRMVWSSISLSLSRKVCQPYR